MQICCNIAKQNLGRTGKNPSVGALIWNNERVVSAVTEIGGVPHAETIAIKRGYDLNIDFKNSTLFVTLEPCSHFGKTPPCINAIIKSEIPRVIIGMQDPDPRVNGNGIKQLSDAGITVELLYTKDIEGLYRVYNVFKCMKRPYICLKIASSLDGKTALANGKSKWITSSEVRHYTNFLRSRFNGILIGSNTYYNDQPALTCRIKGLEKFSPKKFITSTKNIDSFISVKGSIKEIITQIYNHDIQSLLVEGGANLITQFIKEDIFDEILLIQAPILLGSCSKSCIEELSIHSIPTERFVITENRVIDGNVFTRFKR